MGRVFFIWTSVFNLFVVSIFWAMLADLFNSEQAKRLFGFIAAGATLGAITGSALTAVLAGWVSATWLMVGAGLLLEVAVFCVRRLSRLSASLNDRPANEPAAEGGVADRAVGGGVLSGILHAFRSPYLVNVSIFLLLYAVTSTFLYFEQAAIVKQAFSSRAEQTAFFARIDLSGERADPWWSRYS